MATVTVANYSNAVADDAAFRAWVSQTRQALIDAGLTRDTTVSGQIDPTTVVKPAAAGNAGFDIFRFNDASHNSGGKQCFIRIDYGVQTTVTNGRLQLQVATGVNPATGALTGQIGAAFVQSTSAGSGTATLHVSASTDRVWFVWNPTSISNPFFKFGVERLKNSDGTVGGVGLFVYCFTSTSAHNHQVIPFTGSVPTSQSETSPMAICFPYGFYTTNVGITTGWYTSYASDNVFSPGIIPMGKWYYLYICVGKGSDFVAGAVYTLNVLGANRTFLCIEIGGAANSYRLLMPWE